MSQSTTALIICRSLVLLAIGLSERATKYSIMKCLQRRQSKLTFLRRRKLLYSVYGDTSDKEWMNSWLDASACIRDQKCGGKPASHVESLTVCFTCFDRTSRLFSAEPWCQGETCSLVEAWVVVNVRHCSATSIRPSTWGKGQYRELRSCCNKCEGALLSSRAEQAGVLRA